MSGIKIETASTDPRPAFALHDMQGAEFRHIKMPATQTAPIFVLTNVSDFNVFRSKPTPDTELQS